MHNANEASESKWHKPILVWLKEKALVKFDEVAEEAGLKNEKRREDENHERNQMKNNNQTILDTKQ